VSRGSATPLLVVVGPTGSGKSALALALAERLDGEIVGCDALQVYRGLDAATAKPDAEARRRVRHHLVDHVDPRTAYTLAEWVRDAEVAIRDIRSRGRQPLVVGGTGMYLRGLLRGVMALPPVDAALRARLRTMLERRGSARLHRWLAALDPRGAGRIAPGDGQRVTRALELALGPAASWSERLERDGTWATAREREPSVKLLLDPPRDVLERRLDARVARFFATGLVEEVRGLLAAGVPPEANALKAIGYREVLDAIREGRDPGQTLDAVRRSTRRYAKRQRTWFRGEAGLVRLPADLDEAALVERALEVWRSARAEDPR